MENLGLILGSSITTALVIYFIYLNMEIRKLRNELELQDVFISNLKKDIERIYSVIEKVESAFQNDIRRHIEDLREDFNHKADDLSNKNMFDYLNQASSFFNSFVDKSGNKDSK